MSLRIKFKRSVIFTTLFIFCFWDVKLCSAKLIFQKWEKNVNITAYGQEIVEKITATAQLPISQVYTGWSYIFDTSEEIRIVEAKATKKGSTSFVDNELKFEFDGLRNNEKISFFIKYKKINNQDEKFIINRYIGFPRWAKGANAILTIQIPENMILYSFHPELNGQSTKNFYWRKKLSDKNYFRKTLMLTPAYAKWHVQIGGNAIGNDNFTKAKLSIPEYFKNGPYIINGGERKLITNTINTYDVKTKNGYHHFDFSNVNSRLLSVKVDAIIRNGEQYEQEFQFKPYNFLKYNTANKLLYSNIINSIRNDRNIMNLEEHIRIAMWVHNYLKYNEKLIDKKMSVLEIINTKSGVCSHYSILYTELMRFAGVPAFSVAGLSYNSEKKTFENHSWVYIYKGKWIPIDPTWGLYSGKLPVSHIYTYPTIDNIGVEFTAYNYKSIDSIKTDIRSTVEFLE
ncbi:transglutaminase domain-containing protein [Pseudomonadota bacterium]